ncbi:hypothetical protein ALI22I_00370 [Saccharothrix sp. ALI-22-I]|nr:hypothetical protein ALI22I_00370 [Saccharothrix sp. ALI-22-I]
MWMQLIRGRSLEVLLEQAPQEDAAHRTAHQKPISADTLRVRPGIGATQARRLVKIVRAEFEMNGATDERGKRHTRGAQNADANLGCVTLGATMRRCPAAGPPAPGLNGWERARPTHVRRSGPAARNAYGDDASTRPSRRARRTPCNRRARSSVAAPWWHRMPCGAARPGIQLRYPWSDR